MTDFLRLIDVNAGGFRLKKGQGILHPTKFTPKVAGIPLSPISHLWIFLFFSPIFCLSKQQKWSMPDPCSVDFGREAPKLRFEFCRGFLGGLEFCRGFLPPILSKEKARKIHSKKSPAKFTRDFVRKNSPRISAEAFSWEMTTASTFIFCN